MFPKRGERFDLAVVFGARLGVLDGLVLFLARVRGVQAVIGIIALQNALALPLVLDGLGCGFDAQVTAQRLALDSAVFTGYRKRCGRLRGAPPDIDKALVFVCLEAASQ